MKTDVIINRDALYALRELPSESVNCCVTSPPYYGLRDYGLDAQIGREDIPVQKFLCLELVKAEQPVCLIEPMLPQQRRLGVQRGQAGVDRKSVV